MFPTQPKLFARQIREAQEEAHKIHTPTIGIVVDNCDPERLGRVKVRLPTLPGQDTSWWAPLAALGAGNDRGWFLLPEIDDEVVVMFEHGEIGRPVVIGSLWNGVDDPPEKNQGANERAMIVSREGSRIVLDAEKGTVTFEDGKGVGRIVIDQSNKITLEAMQGDVCVQAPRGALNVVARDVKINARQNFNIKAGTNASMSSASTTTIKTQTLTAQGGGKTDVNAQGGAADAAGTSDSCSEVPDPVGP